MPCYSPWNSYLLPNSDDYRKAEEEERAKLAAVKHVVDYYYKAHDHSLPNLPHGTQLDPHRQPRSAREFAIREMICHHLICDQLGFMDLYDVCTLLHNEVPSERSYLAVIYPCANLIRGSKKFNVLLRG
jgi:hypothetical protein